MGFFKFWGRSLWHSFSAGGALFAFLSGGLPTGVVMLIGAIMPAWKDVHWLRWAADNALLLYVLVGVAWTVFYMAYAPYRLYNELQSRTTEEKEKLQGQLCDANSVNKALERLNQEILQDRSKYREELRLARGEVQSLKENKLAEQQQAEERQVEAVASEYVKFYHACNEDHIGVRFLCLRRAGVLTLEAIPSAISRLSKAIEGKGERFPIPREWSDDFFDYVRWTIENDGYPHVSFINDFAAQGTHMTYQLQRAAEKHHTPDVNVEQAVESMLTASASPSALPSPLLPELEREQTHLALSEEPPATPERS